MFVYVASLAFCFLDPRMRGGDISEGCVSVVVIPSLFRGEESPVFCAGGGDPSHAFGMTGGKDEL